MNILVPALVTLLSFGSAFAAAAASAQVNGTFVSTGEMTTARSQHTATLLPDGRVLITGGLGDSVALSNAELYDPANGTFAPTGSMRSGRRMHTATLLPDGRVLIAGGWVPSAEIYDPATGTFAATGGMMEAQGGHSATLLPNGKVLIVGGSLPTPPFPTAARAALYDPARGTFSLAGNYAGTGSLYPSAGGPIWPAANLLPDGKVLLAGDNPPEVYDPATSTFSFTGAMIGSAYRFGTYWHNATTLRDGRVLITGGSDDWCGGIPNAEIYDGSSGTFSVAGTMTTSRDAHTATLLQDGTVLLAGGGTGGCSSPTLDSAELYDPEREVFVAVGKMTRSRSFHTATLLNDGKVLIVGGLSYWPHSTTRSAEVYRPARPTVRRRAARN